MQLLIGALTLFSKMRPYSHVSSPPPRPSRLTRSFTTVMITEIMSPLRKKETSLLIKLHTIHNHETIKRQPLSRTVKCAKLCASIWIFGVCVSVSQIFLIFQRILSAHIIEEYERMLVDDTIVEGTGGEVLRHHIVRVHGPATNWLGGDAVLPFLRIQRQQ